MCSNCFRSSWSLACWWMILKLSKREEPVLTVRVSTGCCVTSETWQRSSISSIYLVLSCSTGPAERGRRSCWSVHPNVISQTVSGSGLCTIRAGAEEQTGSILCMIQPPSGFLSWIWAASCWRKTGPYRNLTHELCYVEELQDTQRSLCFMCLWHCERCWFHEWFNISSLSMVTEVKADWKHNFPVKWNL